jgi:uncharacterized protein YjaZ
MLVLTKPQRKAVHELYRRSADGASNYRTFRRRVKPMLFGGGAVCLPSWCGMYVGIEPDGYTHT